MGDPHADYRKIAHELDLKMDGLSVKILQMASSQKSIEHGTSDGLRIARLELVKCYALAFEVVSQGLKRLKFRNRSRMMVALLMKGDNMLGTQQLLDEFQRQHERFESLMKIASPQEPFDADTSIKMQQEMLDKTQQEIREGLRAVEDGMQKRLADLEHRVVESIRDMLPGIIREEMRKLLVEQRENTNA